MIVSWNNVRDHFKLDDIVYACAYKPTSDKESRHNYQKPIRGRLVAESNEYKDKDARLKSNPLIRYFVPFKRNGVDLAWSRAVTIYSRYFTDNEDECREYYNSLIREQIAWHESEIERLEKDLL